MCFAEPRRPTSKNGTEQTVDQSNAGQLSILRVQRKTTGIDRPRGAVRPTMQFLPAPFQHRVPVSCDRFVLRSGGAYLVANESMTAPLRLFLDRHVSGSKANPSFCQPGWIGEQKVNGQDHGPLPEIPPDQIGWVGKKTKDRGS